VSLDVEAEGLLKGTRGRARQARRELLERLAAEGVPLEELRNAVAEDRLALLPVERALEGKGARFTAEEVAARAGIPAALLRRQRQALGLPMEDPEDSTYTEADLAAAERVRTLLDAGISEEGILETARVMGLAVSQLAAANRAVFGEAMLRAGDTELEAADRYVEAASVLLPLLAPSLEHVLRLHLREQIRHDAIGRAQLAEGRIAGAQDVTACFADMVGFTRLGEELAPEELGVVTGRLSALASEVARPPVRLVKMIGDAAMLVSVDTDAVLDAALGLIDAAESEGNDFPLLRAGVGRGPALARGGDWYGRPVNLASRLTAVAYPGSVLCSKDVQEAANGGYRWSFAGTRRLKGIGGQVTMFRCRCGE
jgi:adenylate cyclase